MLGGWQTRGIRQERVTGSRWFGVMWDLNSKHAALWTETRIPWMEGSGRSLVAGGGSHANPVVYKPW